MMGAAGPNSSSASLPRPDNHAGAIGRTPSRALLVAVAALAVVAAGCGGQDDAAEHAGQFGFDGDRTARVVEDVTVAAGSDGGGGDVLVVGNERDEPVVVVTEFSEVPVGDEARWIATRSRTEPGMAFDQAPVQSAAGVVVEAGDHIDVVTPVEVGSATWCLVVLEPRGSGVASQLPTDQAMTTGTTVDIAKVADVDEAGDGDLVHDLACGP